VVGESYSEATAVWVGWRTLTTAQLFKRTFFRDKLYVNATSNILPLVNSERLAPIVQRQYNPLLG